MTEQNTCFSVRSDGIESSERICRAADVGVSPELCAAQLEHLLEQAVATKLTGEGQASQIGVVRHVLKNECQVKVHFVMY